MLKVTAISSHELAKLLIDAGLIPQGSANVIIELKVGDAVRIHVQTFPDERLLTVMAAFCESAKISKEVVTTEQSACLATAGARDTAPATPLNSLDEEAGKCCAKHLRSMVHPEAEERMECPTCGLSFAREQVGPVYHWRITPVVLIRKR